MMKKYIQILLFLATMVAVPCTIQGQRFYYTCDFDSDSATAGWAFANGFQANKWHIGTATHNGGTGSLYVSNTGGTSNEYTFTSTSFAYAYREFMLDSGSYSISYDWQCSGESNNDYIRVFLVPVSYPLIAGQDPMGGTNASYWSSAPLPSGFISLTGFDTKLNLQPSWQNFISEFTLPSAGRYRLVFAWANDASGGLNPPGAIDNIVFAQPACPRPDNLQFRNIRPTSLDFTWSENENATSWIVEIDSANVTVLADIVYDTSYTVGERAANTTYTVRVASLCGDEDTSMWYSTTFHTPCAYIDSLPYIDDFESSPYSGAVSFDQAFPDCWTRINDATGPYGHFPYISNQPAFAHNSDKGMYWYLSTAAGFSDNQYAILPGVDTSVYRISDLTLAFYAKTHVASDHPAPIVGVMANPYDASTFTPVYTFSDTAITPHWAIYVVPFTDYMGEGNFIAIKCPRPSSNAHLIVDDILLTDDWCNIPLEVSATPSIDEVTIRWNPNGGTSFTVTLDTDTVSFLTDSSYTFTGLTVNTPYSYSVATECAAGYSAFVTGETRTLCMPLDNLPYVQTFEYEPNGSSSSGTDFIGCWYHLNNGTTYGGYPYVNNTLSNHTPDGIKGLYWYNDTTVVTYGDYQCVVLPSIDTDLYPINTLQLSFWASSASASYSPVFVVGIMTDPYNINTFTPVDTVNVSNSTLWGNYTVNFNSYGGFGNHVAIRANRPSSTWGAYMDDITLREMPPCPEIRSLTADEIGSTSAMISWRSTASLTTAYGFDVLYDSVNSISYPPNMIVTDTFATLTNLTPATDYKVIVRALCGSNSDTGDSIFFSTHSLACVEMDPATADTIRFSNATVGQSGCLAYSTYGNTAYQAIYTASELTAAGLTAGRIYGIDLGFTTSSSYDKEFTIFLGNSSTTTINDAVLENPNAQQLVYGPAIHPVGTTGWQHYDFLTPFVWDGSSSIIMTTFMNQPIGLSQTSSEGITGYYEPAANRARCRYKNSDPFTLSDYNSGFIDGSYSNRASIHFYQGECMTLASCAPPLARVVRVEPYEVEIMWAPGYLEGSWNIAHRYGNSGAWVSDLIGTSLTSYIYNGLSPHTQCQFRVTALCGDTTMTTTLSATTPCAPLIELPYTQDFEAEPIGSNITTSAFLACWHRINNGAPYGGYPYVSNNALYNHTSGGTKSLDWYNGTTSDYGDYQVVVLPPVDSSVFHVRDLQLTFWAKSSYSPVFIVGALTDPEDITTFVGIDTIHVGNNTNWTEYEVPLHSYTGNGSYVALRANRPIPPRPSSSWEAYVDDITLDVIPLCPHVDNLTQTGATFNSITLEWEETGEATRWRVEYDTVDFIPGRHSTDSTISNDTTFILTGLDSSRIYYIYVAADCGGGEYGAYRSVRGRTLAAAPAMLPYYCSFEAVGNNGWELLNGNQTNSWYVGSAVNNGGLQSLYISDDGGATNSYNTAAVSYVYATRSINITETGEFVYSYDWRGQGESHYNDFTRVFLAPSSYQWSENINPTSSANTFATWSCPVGWVELTEDCGTPRTLAGSSTWRTVEGNFRLSTTGVYNLVFAWANNSGIGFNPPTAIDNVSLMRSTCPSPLVHVDHTTSDSIAVHWQPGGEESAWLVVCDTVTTVVYDTFYTIGNLSSSTSYTVIVRALCAVGDTSRPSSVVARTQCGLITALPFGHNFDSLSTAGSNHVPECWYGHSTYSSNYPEVVDRQDRYNSGHSLYLSMHYPDSTYTIVQLPGVDTSILPINTLQLNFSHMKEYGSGGVVVGVCTAPGMVGFTPIDTIIVNEYHSWHDFEVPMTDYIGTGSYITLSQYCPNDDLSLYLDEVQLVLAPSCVRPRNLVATTITTSDACLRWTPANGADSTFDIRYGRAGCNVDTLTSIPVTGADTLLLTGLDSGVVYDIYVRTICGSGDTSTWTSGSFRTQASSPINIFPYICDFTSPEGQAWNLENGNETNRWYVGTAAYHGTSDNRGLYISNNNGNTNSYNNSAISFAYAYRTFNMPVGQYDYSFDWRAQGESQYADFLRVFLAPVSDPIIAGQAPTGNNNCYNFASELPPSGWIDLSQLTTAPYTLNQQGTWVNLNGTFTLTAPSSYNLLFVWCNDGSVGTNPPAAIDNVQIYLNTCLPPDNLRSTSSTSTSVTVTWDTNSADHHEVAYGTPGFIPSIGMITTYTNSATITGLMANSSYDVCVRNICNLGTDTSSWARITLRTAMCENGSSVDNYSSSMPTTTSSHSPIGYSFYNYSYVQTIIDSAYMSNIHGNVTAFGFVPASVRSGSYFSNMTVYMANVPESDLSSGFIHPDTTDHIFVTMLTDVDFSYTSTDMQVHTFDTTFTWDGHSNVLFVVNRQHGSYNSGASFQAHTHTGTNGKMRYINQDSGPINPSTVSGGYSSDVVGDITLYTCDYIACPAPDSLQVYDITNSTATFDWVPVVYGTAWQLHVWFSGGIDSIYTVSSHPTTVGGLSPSVTYRAAVRPLCGSDNSVVGNWGDTVTFTTDVCPDVTGLTASVSGNSVTLDWDAHPLAQSWVVEYGYHGFDLGTGTQITTTLNTATVNGLLEEMEYDFHIRTLCAADWYSEEWTTVTATTEMQALEDCDPVAELTAANITQTSALLIWNPGNTGNEWEVVLNDAAGATLIEASTTDRQYQFLGLTPATPYLAKVRTVCGDGIYSDYVGTNFVTISVGIGDMAKPACTIFPNPAGGSTTITVSGVSGRVRIVVVDLHGSELTTATLDCTGDCTKSFDLDRLAPGAYFVRITGENVSMVKKLIVR
jgi:hypothetical protein